MTTVSFSPTLNGGMSDNDNVINMTMMSSIANELGLLLFQSFSNDDDNAHPAISNTSVVSIQDTKMEPMAQTSIEIPQWMIEWHQFRRRLFLRAIEPVIVFLLGPPIEENSSPLPFQRHPPHVDPTHRRLGFLPSYVEDVSYLRATSMSFATLAMMYIFMTIILLVFLSCFYHNQKTSPLFVSPRRHRLPKLVPPPLPVDGAFTWVKVCFFISDEEVRQL